MTSKMVDTLARHAESVQDRRASLKGLGVAALAAALTAPLPAAAKKKKNKNKKKCNAAKASCQAAVEVFCVDDALCLDELSVCCTTCDAGVVAQCIFQRVTF